jgi:hypothetical protein
MRLSFLRSLVVCSSVLMSSAPLLAQAPPAEQPPAEAPSDPDEPLPPAEPPPPEVATEPAEPPPPAYPPPAYPPPAYPPPGAYPPGYYPPPPPGYYPPGYYPGYPVEPPSELPYEEGAPIPPGYKPESRIRKGLVIAGACVFGGVYIFSVIWGSVFISAEGEGEGYEALYVPVVGPFIAMGTIEGVETSSGALLAVDGIAQVGGVAMFIAGLAAKKQVLVRTYETATVDFTPAFGPGGGALTARVRF